MATIKMSKKAKQPLAIRVIKIIVIALACAILLAAIAERIIHFYRHITK
jgi:cytochrome c-type biogenesis protein CcmE